MKFLKKALKGFLRRLFKGEIPGRRPSLVFGRRKGRPLHVRKAALIDTLLPRLRLKPPRKKGTADPLQWFGATKPAPLWLEIGFGGGEHLAAQAKLHPDYHLIGCEPFLNGVASLLDHLDNGKIENVRVYDDDARHILDALPDASLDRCFVLFADPWPKSRHAERRFIGPENLTRIARVLKPSGLLRIASDHPILIEWMRGRANEHPAFTCAHDGPTPPADWVETRYQQKAVAAGRTPIFMDFIRN